MSDLSSSHLSPAARPPVTVAPLRFRPISSATAAFARALGQGLQLEYAVQDELGELVLQPLPPELSGALQGRALETAHGLLWLEDAGAVLSLFGGAPAIVTDEEPQAWYWQYFNQFMSPELQSLFGELSPARQAPPLPDDVFSCRLTLQIAGSVVQTRISALPDTFLALLQAVAWQPMGAGLPEDWPLSTPIIIGRLTLSAATVRSLQPGDVVLPMYDAFDCGGQGRVRIGPFRSNVQLQGADNRVSITLFDLEDQPVDDDYLGDAPPEEYGQEAPLTGSFADLPMALTIRSGTLTLTLQELQHLGPGSVLEIPGVSPGTATLYYGERPVAQGELVDVDGRLGLQITRMELV